MHCQKPPVRPRNESQPDRDRPASTAWVRYQGLEKVRQAMLASLSGGAGGEVARMSIRVRYAPDIEALWYLRNDLLGILVSVHGEGAAGASLDQITQLFHGQLPTRTTARPARAHAS